RSFGWSRNREYVHCTNSTDFLRNLRYTRQIRNVGDVVGKKRRADVRLRGGIWVARRISYASLGRVALRQCEWNGAHGHKQKQIKCASNKMRFDGGINLLFHFGFVLVRIRIF